MCCTGALAKSCDTLQPHRPFADDQAPLLMRFSSKEYWIKFPFPPPGDMPDPRVERQFPVSPALAGGFFITEQPWKPIHRNKGTRMCRKWFQ